MRRRFIIIAIFMAVVSGLAASAAAEGHGDKRPKKVGILLVAFGSSEPRAQVSFENIDKKVKAVFHHP
jgi:sirohydrochlorin cobaltochelatase